MSSDILLNMKTLGVIGGMSWESTVLYYQWINRGIKRELGGLHSAKMLLSSVDFAEIEVLQHAGDWAGAKVGLLGTGFTMRDEFYKGRMQGQFDIDVIVPDEGDMHAVHQIIYDELCLGEIVPSSRDTYLAVIDRLAERGLQLSLPIFH